MPNTSFVKYLEMIGMNDKHQKHKPVRVHKSGAISIQIRLRKVQSKWGRYDGEIFGNNRYKWKYQKHTPVSIKAGNISIQIRLRKVQSKWGRYDGEIGRAWSAGPHKPWSQSLMSHFCYLGARTSAISRKWLPGNWKRKFNSGYLSRSCANRICIIG